MAGKKRRLSLRVRRPVRLTFAGKLFLGVTVGVGLAAVNTGNNLLYLVLGLLLSLLLLSGVLSEIALRRIRVSRRLPERAFVGATTLVEIVLDNGKRWLPSYSLEVEDRAMSVTTERRCYFLKVAPQAEQVAAYRRTPERRGVLRLIGFKVSTRYPFGLIEKSRIVDEEGELLVYPRLVPVSPQEHRHALDGNEVATGLPGPGTEIAGIRDYRGGDEARVIHWRRTASLGRLVVRDTERDALQRLTLSLDNARPKDADEAWDHAFEEAVSRTASLAASALSRGAAVDVVVRGARSPLVQPGTPPDPIWRFLALLETCALEDARPMEAGSRGGRSHAVPVLRGAA